MLRSLTTILAALVGGYSSGAAQESSAARDTAEVSEITGRLAPSLNRSPSSTPSSAWRTTGPR